MIITVEHKVPFDKGTEAQCVYNDGDFWGRTVCEYHVLRDRTHGKKAPIERKQPKCTLFGVWLQQSYTKCDECLAKCMEQEGER